MTERTPGSWRLRAFVGRDANGHPVQVTRTFRGGKRQAELELARLVAEVADRGAPLSGSVTVAQLLTRWLDHVTPLRQPGTVRAHRSCVDAVVAELGHLRLNRLTAQDLDLAYSRWLASGRSAATVRRYHSVLAAALHQARRWGLVAQVTTELASPPTVRARPPSAPDAQAVQLLVELAEQENPILSMTILLAAMTGARLGELCALRWSDIDLERQVLQISRSVKHGVDKRDLVIGPTKTHQERRLALDSLAQDLLARHRRRMDDWASEVGAAVRVDGFILPGGPAWGFDPTGGEPLRPNTVSSAFARLAKRSGLKVRFHDLRHFSATQLIGAGVDVRTVAHRLGHADPSTTLRVYAHTIAARDREAAAILGRLVSEPRPDAPAAGLANNLASCETSSGFVA